VAVVDVRGIPIHFEEHGAGRPLLAIHGVTTDHRHVEATVEPAFAGRSGWWRLYPDLPGRGQTPAADGIDSQDDILDVTLAFLDSVAPGQRFAVLGTSWGAYIAMGVIHRRAADVDGAAFVVGNPRRTGRTTPQPQVVVPADEELLASLREDERDWADFAVVQTREMLELDRRLIQPAIAAADMPFIERVEGRTNFSFEVRELARFERPTLIVNARQDPVAGYADMLEMLETFPRATMAILDRAGHNVAAEQAVLFGALVGDWLDRIEGAAALS
jgi:pimeloyl-ACP methyl ester carboxylesterase